ncbi:hypothetical protein BGZ65_005793, partial [Modicella reniformis]
MSSSASGDLSQENALKLATFHLEGARKSTDPDLALVLYKEAEMVLARMKQFTMAGLPRTDCNQDQSIREGIANAVSELDKMSTSSCFWDKLQTRCKKVKNLGEMQLADGAITENVIAMDSTFMRSLDQHGDIATLAPHIFGENKQPPVTGFRLPEPDERLQGTSQLAHCMYLLKLWSSSPDDIQEPTERDWICAIENDEDERERLRTLVTDVIRAFTRIDLKDANAVAEVVCLAPVLEKDDFHDLLGQFYNDIERSVLLNSHQLEGIAQLIKGAGSNYLTAADLVKIFEQLKDHLRDIHKQSPPRVYRLTLMISNVLDAMADAKVKGLDREQLDESLSSYFDILKEASDAFLVYQAAYAYQSTQYILDGEPLWQTALQRSRSLTRGQSTTANAAHTVELDRLLESLNTIQKGLNDVPEVSQTASSTHKGPRSLTQSGRIFLDCINEGLSFEYKQAWYPALRMADVLLQGGQFADFRKLIYEAPCRRNPAFQWGLCQRLGVLTVNSKWDTETHQNAVALLGEIYQNDAVWGHQATVKQWIVNILMQLTSIPHAVKQTAKAVLRRFGTDEDPVKRVLYQSCRKADPNSYPLKIVSPSPSTPSLLDRVQDVPDVETRLRL